MELEYNWRLWHGKGPDIFVGSTSTCPQSFLTLKHERVFPCLPVVGWAKTGNYRLTKHGMISDHDSNDRA